METGQRVRFYSDDGREYHGTVVSEEDYVAPVTNWQLIQGQTYRLVTVAVEELGGVEMRVVSSKVHATYPKFTGY